MTYLKLINYYSKVTPSYRPTKLLQDPITRVWLDEQVLMNFYKMNQALQKEGLSALVLVSGYRAFALQKKLYNQQVENLVRLSAPFEDISALVTYLPAGTSEHQSGLCMDVCTAYMQQNFEELSQFEYTFHKKWLDSKGAEFGFILRYPKDKEHITHVKYKPYHYRYVGVNHAQKMRKQNLCLEEYLSQHERLRYNNI
ncbi:MAG: hypothetical protein BEN18_03425 [Epulopiscium sp. Nuni2H_MBin001]|nr:MAG: hypothetical protein BEN18_03425 [Epulopiscium sp. Nuni2H_MBin001]